MKKVFASLLFSAFTFAGIAQTDAKSDEILKSVSAKYKSYKSLSASFKVTIENLKDKSVQNQKGAILVKGDKYKLDITGQEIYCDGKTSWSYLKESNEVQINNADSKSDAINPTTIFTLYEKGFQSKFINEQDVKGKTLQQVELIPVDKKKPYFKVQVWIEKAQKYISTAKIFNNNGTRLTYNVEKFTPDAPADDNVFSFDTKKYPGVEVVDLR